MFRLATQVLILLFSGLLLADGSLAGSGKPQWGTPSTGLPMRAVPQRDSVPLTTAISAAQHRFPGRVIKAETKANGSGRRQHVVRIISDQGRVRTFHIDAQTGEFL